MDKLKTDIDGGFPFFLDDFRFEQAAVREVLTIIFKRFGDNFIIQGCEIDTENDLILEGYIFLDGEILKVDEQDHNTYFTKSTVYNSSGNKTFYNGSDYDTWEENRGVAGSTVSNLSTDGPRWPRDLNKTSLNIGSASSRTWDLNKSLRQKIILYSNTTLTITNAESGDFGVLMVTQNSTGGYSLTLPANSKYPGGSLSLTTAANAVDLLYFYYDGTNFHWTVHNNFS